MAIMYKEVSYMLRTNDFDINDNITVSGVLDYFQELAGAHAKDIGVGFDDMVSKGYYWILLRTKFDILKAPFQDEDVIVSTWPKEKGRADFDREYKICDKDGTTLITGISKWVVINKDTRRLVRGNDVNFIGEYYSESLYTEFPKLAIVEENLIKEYSYLVENDDLDHNRHMNNSKYGNIILNMLDLSLNEHMHNLEIEYIHEAKLNDTINTKLYKTLNKYYFVGFVNEVKCFQAILTMEE